MTAPLAADGLGTARLGRRRYAKLGLRVVDVRDQGPHFPAVRADVAVSVEGGLDSAYLGQGNDGVVPTDCLRAAAMGCLERRLAAGAPLLKGLSAEVGRELLARYGALPNVTVKVRQLPLGLVMASGPNRVYLGGAPSGRQLGGLGLLPEASWHNLDRAAMAQGRPANSGGGQRDMWVVVHGQHHFTGFDPAAVALRPPSEGARSLVGKLRYRWESAAEDLAHHSPPAELLGHLMQALAQESQSVQHLLARGAAQVLEASEELTAVTVSLRSQPVTSVGSGARAQAEVLVVERGPVALTTVTVTRQGPCLDRPSSQ